MRGVWGSRTGHGAVLLTLSIGLVVGCGSGADTTNTAAPPTTSTTSTTGGAPPTAPSAALPSATAQLKIGQIPAGWTFVTEERPPTERGNAVIIQIFQGPEVDIPNPSGGPSRLTVAVDATHIPGMVASGRARDLVALGTGIGPQDWTEEARTSVAGHEAIELTRPVGPTSQRMLVMTTGDWRIQATGTAVDADTLLAFAKAVELA